MVGIAASSLPEFDCARRRAAMCNAEMEMPAKKPLAASTRGEGLLVLGVDTCGPTGTLALARIEGPGLETRGSPSHLESSARILAQTTLAGRTYSSTLIGGAGELLKAHGVRLADLGAIVTVHGPGSFTGIRVGVSAVKGLAEPGRIPVVAISRLRVLAAKAGLPSSALDAHRHEVFLHLSSLDGGVREILAGAEDLAPINPPPGKVAISEERAAALLGHVWPNSELVRTDDPTAADAIRWSMRAILAGESVDLALLDGLYLRRSDAEIFGDSPSKTKALARVQVRQMKPEDLGQVVQIAHQAHYAALWPPQAYEKALDPTASPRRVALVAEDPQSGSLVGFLVAGLMPPEAELESIVTTSSHQRRGVARELFASLKNELRHQAVQAVTLEVRTHNKAAQGFYRALGFSFEGRRPAYYADPVEDAILMRLEIA